MLQIDETSFDARVESPLVKLPWMITRHALLAFPIQHTRGTRFGPPQAPPVTPVHPRHSCDNCWSADATSSPIRRGWGCQIDRRPELNCGRNSQALRGEKFGKHGVAHSQ